MACARCSGQGLVSHCARALLWCAQLMDIIINSLYSKKEIFLRELISNGTSSATRHHLRPLFFSSLFIAHANEWTG